MNGSERRARALVTRVRKGAGGRPRTFELSNPQLPGRTIHSPAEAVAVAIADASDPARTPSKVRRLADMTDAEVAALEAQLGAPVHVDANKMRCFERDQADDAIAYALSGSQGLHVYPRLAMDAPGCFRRSPLWAHLYDQDRARLERTARQLGVRDVLVHHAGRCDQHVDLCGKPLDRALARVSTRAA